MAQSDDPSLVWVGKQKTASKKVVPQKVVAVRKPHHKPPVKTIPRKPPVKLLSLRWSLRLEGKDGKPMAVAPNYVFKVGDRAQIVVEVNEPGFLYLIQEESLSMIFPHPLINKGNNQMVSGQSQIIPSNCGQHADKNGQCWFEVDDKGSSITLIFSRDQIKGLPDSMDAEQKVVPITRQDLTKLRGNINQNMMMKDITDKGIKAVQYWNNNPKDNEDLIIETKINYEKPERNN